MRLLVTGGAGFIGSHYVRTVLGDAWGGPTPEAVVVLDQLTYAGNLRNLDPVERRPAAGGGARRHLRRATGRPARRRGRRGRPPRRRVPRRPLDRGCRRLRRDQRARHPDPPRRGPPAPGRAVRPRLHRRGLRVHRDRVLDRGRAAAAQLAVLRLQGGLRPDGTRLPPHPRRPGLHHAVLEQLRALPAPREGDPALRHQPARRPGGAVVRRGAQRAGLAPRRRPLPGDPPRGRRRPAGGGLQHRRRHRADQRRAHRAAAGGDRSRVGAGAPGPGPARPRPALLRGLHQDRDRARLRAAHRVRAGARRRRGLVRRQPGLVGAAQELGHHQRSPVTGHAGGARRGSGRSPSRASARRAAGTPRRSATRAARRSPRGSRSSAPAWPRRCG